MSQVSEPDPHASPYNLETSQSLLRMHQAVSQAEDLESFHRSIVAALSTITHTHAARALAADGTRNTYRTICGYGSQALEDPIDTQDLLRRYQDVDNELAPGVFRENRPGSPQSLISLPFKTSQRHYTIYLIETPKIKSQQTSLSLATLRPVIERGIHKLQKIEALTHSNRVKNQLIASTSHDLRNLLTAVASTSSYLHEAMTDMGGPAAILLPDLINMQRAADKMTAITSQLLDLTALDTGRTKPDCQSRDLYLDLGEYIKLYTTAARDKEIALEITPPADTAMAFVDADRIARVFDNILSNAIKYTRPQGTVKVTWTQTAYETITHIEDTGVGMKPGDLASLFQEYRPLSSVPTAGETSTGLGLAIAKRIVDVHNGRMWAVSERGVGSRFSFALPRATKQGLS